MKILTLLFTLSVFAVSAQIPNAEEQIANAVLALDEGDRDGATVLGFDTEGNIFKLRGGTNSLICISDDPNKEGFSVACYHENLEPFMARGRDLREEGKERGEIEKIREEEAKAGKLKMPEKASTLYVLSGKNKDDANLRWVVYIPFSTAESTGLPIKPMVAGGPWIMFPGTYRAHIMISPPQ
jgi:hypothetical protein